MLAALLASALLFPFAWTTGGVMASGPRAVFGSSASDFAGGVLVGWEEQPPNTDIPDAFGTKLSASGAPGAGWPSLGVPLANTERVETTVAVAAGLGQSSYWLWDLNETDIRLGESLYLRRLLADGSFDPSWPAGGKVVMQSKRSPVIGPDWPSTPQLSPDGQGGALAFWEDGYLLAGTRGTLRAQRVLASGATAPGWPDSGLVLVEGPQGQRARAVVDDGAGGGFFVWEDLRDGGQRHVNALHVLADGTPAPGWSPAGVRVTPTNTSQYALSAMRDDAGGLYVTWDDEDIHLQRLTASGTVAPGWPAEGAAVHVGPGFQESSTLCRDDNGGVYVGWEDLSTGLIDVMRMTSAGTPAPGWPAGGRVVAQPPGYGENAWVASDGLGGVFVAWIQQAGSGRAYCQHLNGDGSYPAGWGVSGTLLVDVAASSQNRIKIFEAEVGSAIAVWDNFVPDPLASTIRAQKLVSEGVVPVALSLQSAEATAAGVRLTWWGVGAAVREAWVERSADGVTWGRLGRAVGEGSERLTYDDAAAPRGASVAYRLTDGAGSVLVAASWVEVPQALRFALHAPRPNPVRAGDFAVEFTLAERGSGTVELLDLEGRRLAWRSLSDLSPGAHTLPMPEAASLPPGVCWVRLRQGPRTASTRVVLTQ